MDAKWTREHIVRTADELFYRQGFQHTSFADAVGISRGNFYYHFKTKDEILAAVIGARITERRRMLGQWDAEQFPAVPVNSQGQVLGLGRRGQDRDAMPGRGLGQRGEVRRSRGLRGQH
jgi:AcrR family transcriptional regulator